MTNAITLAACAEMLWSEKPVYWCVNRFTKIAMEAFRSAFTITA